MCSLSLHFFLFTSRNIQISGKFIDSINPLWKQFQIKMFVKQRFVSVNNNLLTENLDTKINCLF